MIDILTQLAVGKINATQVGVPQTSGNDLLANSLDIVYFIAGAAAVIVIIFAGIMYVTSSGDAGRVAKAKNTLLYSVVGLIVAFLAFAIVNWVLDVF